MKQNKIEITEEESTYLWNLMPKWIKEIPGKEHEWDPLFFGTLSRDGDIEIRNKVLKILGRNISNK